MKRPANFSSSWIFVILIPFFLLFAFVLFLCLLFYYEISIFRITDNVALYRAKSTNANHRTNENGTNVWITLEKKIAQIKAFPVNWVRSIDCFSSDFIENMDNVIHEQQTCSFALLLSVCTYGVLWLIGLRAIIFSDLGWRHNQEIRFVFLLPQFFSFWTTNTHSILLRNYAIDYWSKAS